MKTRWAWMAACFVSACTTLRPGTDVLRDAAVIPPDVGAACPLRHPPSRPNTLDSPSVAPSLFALRQFVYRQDHDMIWARTGYDLDGICTQAPLLQGECTNAMLTVDGEDGIDNMFGFKMFPLFELIATGYGESSRAMHEEARNAIVIGISEWNGTPDDPNLQIWVGTTVGATAGTDTPPVLTFTSDGHPLTPEGAAAAPVRWDGNDWVYLRSDTYVSGGQPRTLDDNAFVANGVFVMRVPDRADVLFFGTDSREGRMGELLTSRIRLTGSVATFSLNAAGTELTEGTIAGRWAVSDALATSSEIGICPDDIGGIHDFVEGQLANFADLRSTSPEPGSALLPCNAMSFGTSFIGTRVRIAGEAEGPTPTNLCATIAQDAGPTMPDAGTAF